MLLKTKVRSSGGGLYLVCGLSYDDRLKKFPEFTSETFSVDLYECKIGRTRIKLSMGALRCVSVRRRT